MSQSAAATFQYPSHYANTGNQLQSASFQTEIPSSSNNAKPLQTYSSYQNLTASNTDYQPIRNQAPQHSLNYNDTSQNRFSDLFEPIDLDSVSYKL